MDKNNPYKTPDTINPENRVTDGSPIGSMDRKRFNKLYYRSVNVSTIAVLLVISACVSIWAVFLQSKTAASSGGYIIISPFFYVFLALAIIAAIGLFMRTTWGRIAGILACVLMLINIPIGTIIGIAGLFALLKAPELYGSNRFLHKDLKKEYKIRKREKRF